MARTAKNTSCSCQSTAIETQELILACFQSVFFVRRCSWWWSRSTRWRLSNVIQASSRLGIFSASRKASIWEREREITFWMGHHKCDIIPKLSPNGKAKQNFHMQSEVEFWVRGEDKDKQLESLWKDRGFGNVLPSETSYLGEYRGRSGKAARDEES